MTCLWMDSSAAGATYLPSMYSQSPGGGGSASVGGVVTGPFGAGSYAVTNATLLSKNITAASEVFAAARFLWPGTSTAVNMQFKSDAGATTHITVLRNASRLIEVRRGTTGGTLLATGTTVISDDTWTHLQVRCTISDTVGVVQVRLNGSTSNEINFSGDTKNAGTATTIDNVTLTAPGSGNYCSTDFVVFDTAGTLNNTWPGDCRVQVLTPNGDGASSQGVGSDGNSTSNYQLVDELPPSSTDYVGITNNGDGDTYALSDLAAGTTSVLAVQPVTVAAKSDAGSKSVKERIRSGGTNYAGSSHTLSTTYQGFVEAPRETDPATSSAWTGSGVNALESGFEAAA